MPEHAPDRPSVDYPANSDTKTPMSAAEQISALLAITPVPASDDSDSAAIVSELREDIV